MSIFLLGASLFPIAWEDFRHRAVRAIWLGLFLLCCIWTGWETGRLRHFGETGIFLISTLLILTLYFSMRNARWVDITKDYLGWADIIFMLGLCLIFPLPGLLVYLVASFILTLISHTLCGWLSKSHNPHIPLAGFLSITLLATLCMQKMTSIRPMDADWINQHIRHGLG